MHGTDLQGFFDSNFFISFMTSVLITDVLAFWVKAITVAAVILLILSYISMTFKKPRERTQGKVRLEVKDLRKDAKDRRKQMRSTLDKFDPDEKIKRKEEARRKKYQHWWWPFGNKKTEPDDKKAAAKTEAKDDASGAAAADKVSAADKAEASASNYAKTAEAKAEQSAAQTEGESKAENADTSSQQQEYQADVSGCDEIHDLVAEATATKDSADKLKKLRLAIHKLQSQQAINHDELRFYQEQKQQLQHELEQLQTVAHTESSVSNDASLPAAKADGKPVSKEEETAVIQKKLQVVEEKLQCLQQSVQINKEYIGVLNEDIKLTEEYLPARERRELFVSRIKEKREQGIFCPRNLFVLTFNGSTDGREVGRLTREINYVLTVATAQDEVVVRLTSPGGMVNSYGLLASQLYRLRQHGIHLVCCVDSVAASGGYMMACVADKIVAAPFAYVGSIGVVAAIPNFNRLMHRYDVDYEQVTAGKYKRTLTMFGENTEEGREKFKEDLEAIHARFKALVLKFRPHLDIDKVATGECWLASDAKELGLVDEIATFDEYLERRMEETYNAVLSLRLVRVKQQSVLSKLHLPFSSLGTDKKELAQIVREQLREHMAQDDVLSQIR